MNGGVFQSWRSTNSSSKSALISWTLKMFHAAPYTSYTEEEFYRALAQFEKEGKPTIFVFFKHIDPGRIVVSPYARADVYMELIFA